MSGTQAELFSSGAKIPIAKTQKQDVTRLPRGRILFAKDHSAFAEQLVSDIIDDDDDKEASPTAQIQKPANHKEDSSGKARKLNKVTNGTTSLAEKLVGAMQACNNDSE